MPNTITYFPTHLPAPTMVQGPFDMDETTVTVVNLFYPEPGSSFFLYRWNKIGPSELEQFKEFSEQHSRTPIHGWKHHCVDEPCSVILSDLKVEDHNIKSHIGVWPPLYTVSMAAFIIHEGDATASVNRQ